MVFRIFIDKSNTSRATSLCRNLQENLKIPALTGVRLFYRYDVEGLSREEFARVCKSGVFAGARETILENLPNNINLNQTFAVQSLPGQYSQRNDISAQTIQAITGNEPPTVRFAEIISVVSSQPTDSATMNLIKAHVINRLESCEADMILPQSLKENYPAADSVEILRDFNDMNDADLRKELAARGFAMSFEDLKFCQKYFRDTERRPPTIAELKTIDTYWSDHCRHTTFNTIIKEINFDDGELAREIRQTFSEYLDDKKKLAAAESFKRGNLAELDECTAGGKIAAKSFKRGKLAEPDECTADGKLAAESFKRGKLAEPDECTADGGKLAAEKPVTLMDLGTIAAKSLKRDGILTGLDESDEINACSIKVTAEIDGRAEDWLVMFKNETHNHPTEIEPFGGAATCLGGAIRDPLSGRVYVYQAMRVTGAADPRKPFSETLPGKLPQRKIVQEAARGYSSYGNQIGLATGQVREIYHEGYLAKRMEIGAVIGAAPAKNVIREKPAAGDLVLLVGGRTGRDGIGGATGSSKVHTTDSMNVCGAEVQKGNPLTERKIQRLFKNPAASKLIKRCNDFGAGGVAVAVGELAAGLEINLDAVRKKYEGLDGTELAISESQERMAVVLSPENVAEFVRLADEENLEAYVIAEVTAKNKLVMNWRGENIISVSRDFLDTNGVRQFANVSVAQVGEYPREELTGDLKTKWLKNLLSLNVCSQKGLAEQFDSTVGAGTVLMPFGGKNQLTPAEGMVAKLPVSGETKTATAMTFGFDAKISAWSPYHGAIDAVTSSLAKLTAIGADFSAAYLSFQEYFERLGDSAEKWGKPFAALLGAYKAQKKFGVAAIGGKDSMSGTYENLNVPPTLVSFAVAVVDADKVISPEFKAAGHKVYLINCARDERHIPDFNALKKNFAAVHKLIGERKIISALSIGAGGIAEAVSKMAVGNDVGFRFAENGAFFEKNYGSLIVEAAAGVELDFVELGETIGAAQIEIGAEKISLVEIKRALSEPLEKIYPTRIETPENPRIAVELFETSARPKPRIKIAQPRVFIPVFPGTNCEYESARCWKFAGANPNIFVLRNLTPSALEETFAAMCDEIRKSQIIMFPGGFSGGDEPDGAGKFIAAICQNQRVAEEIMNLLQKRDGLILGICNGFQALMLLGLLPHGEIRQPDANSPVLTYNSLGRHVSQMVRTRVTSNLSPWLAGNSVGDIHTIAVSHGEGRFVANADWLKKLAANGQIATQYVDFDGNPTNELPQNPNGSYLAIEGITSADGRVLGKMGHSERIGANVCKNVPGNKNQHIFEAGVNYFG